MKILEWDSGLLGVKVARMEHEPAVQFIEECKRQGVQLAFANVTEHRRLSELAANKFKLVSILVKMEADGGGEMPEGVRKAMPRDLKAIMRLTRFPNDHFHADKRIDRKKADALNAEWGKNDLNGRADEVWVAGAGSVEGFIALKNTEHGLNIDLLAVSPKSRGTGLGHKLISVAKARAPQKNLLAATHAANVDSLAFYFRQGFRPVAYEYIFHKWFD